MAYYLIRMGEGSKHSREALKGGFVAIGFGWNAVPDLRQVHGREAIQDALDKSNDYSPAQVAARAGQLFRFGFEMEAGDRALMPLGDGQYAVGALGDYYYEARPTGECDYQHRRSVTWLPERLSKDDMSTNLAYSLGALLTVFSLDKYAQELDQLIAGQPYTPAETPQRVRDIVLTTLMELDGREFEQFVRHVLELVGFAAEATQYVGDKGIDVNGVLDADGLASITLRVQVKRVRGSVGNREVLALRGALSQGEQGCLITLSSFTAQAQEEAEAPGKVPIRLIDGNDFAGLVLRHFDELGEDYKASFPIRRRKDISIEDQFEAATGPDEAEPAPQREPARKDVEWDTLVCPAREDGFKQAFLGEKAWWAVRLRTETMAGIKYIAIYQVAPISKITYYGEVDRIEPYGDSGKYKIVLKGDPIKLATPPGQEKGKALHLQGPRYTRLSTLLKAKTVWEAFD